MDKQKIFQEIDALVPQMNEQAFAIFDMPEVDGEEHFATELLQNALKEDGFAIETGFADLPTSFRATWKNGEGGPNIGFLGEFDALRGTGHACGHHMQTPIVIAAAKVLKKHAEQENIPCTITVYGTPAEETFGGKINMANAGCFKELDVALGTHAGNIAKVMGTTLALRTYTITFHGTSAHASGSPHIGRSAMDAMLLMFNAIEFLREHILETSRIHYAIRESIMPTNVVPARAVCDVCLRSPDTNYLHENILPRFEKIVDGACLMTETTADKFVRSDFAGCFPNKALNQVAIDNLNLLPVGEVPVDPAGGYGKGTTDFGNVCHVTPTAYIHIPFSDGPSHSQDWLDHGKSDRATECMRNSAKLMAGMGVDLLTKPELLKAIREEFNTAQK